MEAKYFCSLIRNMREAAKLAPASSAAALTDSSRSILSRIGTAMPFFTTGVRQATSPTRGTGASRTGSDWMRALARAMATAWRAAAATASSSSLLVAAKPHAPPATTRTPTPTDSSLATLSTRSSRVISDWRR